MKLRTETIALLEDIENRINPEVEEDFINQWKAFINNKTDDIIFKPKRKLTSKSSLERQNININDALLDKELMLLKEMQGVSNALESESNNTAIRANYGTGIMTSLFGAKIFTMPYENDTLPTTYSFNNDDKIREAISNGIPELNKGYGKDVFETGEFYKEVLSKYPKISKYVKVYHPDTQGPLDICELLWGGEMFYCMYDEPEMVHDMLKLVNKTYIKFLDKWFDLFPVSSDFNMHWANIAHKGKIVIRNDSAMNLSPEFYDEFAFPYDKELLDYYDGGVVHFCGKGDHYIGVLSKADNLYGINMSQPEYNDMEIIYKNTVDKGIKLLGFNASQAKNDVDRICAFNCNMHIS